MCRLPKKVQHVDKVSSSAEEGNWDYNKFQTININNPGPARVGAISKDQK